MIIMVIITVMFFVPWFITVVLWSPMDANSYTILRTLYALAKWDIKGLKGLREHFLNPERRTGQGYIHCPYTWLGVLMSFSENLTGNHLLWVHRPDGSLKPMIYSAFCLLITRSKARGGTRIGFCHGLQSNYYLIKAPKPSCYVFRGGLLRRC